MRAPELTVYPSCAEPRQAILGAALEEEDLGPGFPDLPTLPCALGGEHVLGHQPPALQKGPACTAMQTPSPFWPSSRSPPVLWPHLGVPLPLAPPGLLPEPSCEPVTLKVTAGPCRAPAGPSHQYSQGPKVAALQLPSQSWWSCADLHECSGCGFHGQGTSLLWHARAPRPQRPKALLRQQDGGGGQRHGNQGRCPSPQARHSWPPAQPTTASEAGSPRLLSEGQSWPNLPLWKPAWSPSPHPGSVSDSFLLGGKPSGNRALWQRDVFSAS